MTSRFKSQIVIILMVCWALPIQAQLDTRQALGNLNKVKQQLKTNVEQIKPKLDLKKIKPDFQVSTTDQLLEPLLKLPQDLPILNRNGQTVLVDVEVENGWRAIQQEWLIILDDGELASLQNVPVKIVEQTFLPELEMTLVRFRVTPELDSLEALTRHLPENMAKRLDRNHVYRPQTASANNPSVGFQSKTICHHPLKIGMIDTAIQQDHPAFSAAVINQKIITKNFLDESLPEPEAHGTAVAGVLIGKGDQLIPLAPDASLYAASVFYVRNDYAQGATMMSLVRALDWLMMEKVSVINMSLAGPDNQILAKAINKILSQGVAVVAAVGNEGPAVTVMYPAAYPGVIAATAVDSNQKIYRWANRGPQVYFAAPGVSVFTARSDGQYGHESGTSMAAPVISAYVACELVTQNNLKEALAGLQTRALDLGEPGRDPVFGFGLLSGE
jgi:minor extracellular protease Epr